MTQNTQPQKATTTKGRINFDVNSKDGNINSKNAFW